MYVNEQFDVNTRVDFNCWCLTHPGNGEQWRRRSVSLCFFPESKARRFAYITLDPYDSDRALRYRRSRRVTSHLFMSEMICVHSCSRLERTFSFKGGLLSRVIRVSF